MSGVGALLQETTESPPSPPTTEDAGRGWPTVSDLETILTALQPHGRPTWDFQPPPATPHHEGKVSVVSKAPRL